jgi:hypothetical protein
MNLEQLIAEINKDLDDELDNAELTGWINRCMDDLSPHANLQKSAVISLFTDQKEYDLPSDYMRLFQLVDTYPMNQVQMRDFISTGFKLWGNKLIIQPTPLNEGTLDLYYEAKLPYLVNVEDEPAIPSQFHDLFILYTIARRQYQDDEEALQMNVWTDYQRRKSEFIAFMTQQLEPSQVQDVYFL